MIQRVDEEVFAVGNWLQEFVLDFQVAYRIATPERGYPTGEAAYASVEEWEADTGKDFYTTMAGDLMQQARELLAAEYSKIGNTFRAEDIRNGRVNADEHLAINAIRAALSQARTAAAINVTPPEPKTQPAAAPGIDLQWLVEGLDEIGSLSCNLRQGGCDAGDLEGLENGLMHAVDMAHQLRDHLLTAYVLR